MASFEDAVAGWEVYRSRQGAVSRTQLNQSLRSQGLEPIAERTFTHYGKLLRLGYSEYVSINRLDIRHANDSVFDINDRSRYQDRVVDRDGRLVLPRSGGLTTLVGKIGKVSEGFATLRVPYDEESESISRAVKYNRGVLVFDEVGIERAVRVIEGIPRGTELDLLLEFRSLLETDILFPDSPYPVGISNLVVNLGHEAALSSVLQTVHATFDLFESVRGLVDLTASATSDGAPATPTPRVQELRFSNPLEVVIVGAVVVIGGVTWVVNKISTSVGNAADAANKVQAVKNESAAEQRRHERHTAEIQSLQLDNVKKAIEVGALLEELNPGLSEVLGVEIPELPASAQLHAEALKDQAVEAAVELELAGDEPLEVGEVDPGDDASS